MPIEISIIVNKKERKTTLLHKLYKASKTHCAAEARSKRPREKYPIDLMDNYPLVVLEKGGEVRHTRARVLQTPRGPLPTSPLS